MQREAARERLAAALGKRVGPGTGIPYKTLAHAIGRGVTSVIGYVRGEQSAPIEAVAAMIGFFSRIGDAAFGAEVFGDAIAPAHRTGDDCRWLTERGEALAAPAGLRAMAGAALGLPPGMGDEAAYARRALGWVGWTLRADGLLLIEIERGMADPAAIARARDLAAAQRDSIRRVQIATHQGEAVATRDYDWLGAALDALDRAGAVTAIAAQPLVRRATETAVDLNALDRPRRHLFDACAPDGNVGDMLEAAQRCGMLDRTALVRVGDDGAVRLLYAGDGVRIRPDAIGREAGEMDDIVYGQALRRDMVRAAAAGRSFTRVRLEADEISASYTRLAIRGAGGIVLTANVVDTAPSGVRVG